MIRIVSDFDRTLTQGKSGIGGTTSWSILENFMNQKCLNSQRILFQKYRQMEIDGRLSHDDAIRWWEASLENVVNSGINFNLVSRAIGTKLTPRQGVTELFLISEKYGIPLVLLSAGLKNIIDSWCRHWSFKPDMILSTELILNDESVISGWNKKSLVHVLNKNEHARSDSERIKQSRPFIILLGDSADDAAMADGEDTVIRILIDDPREDEKISRSKDRSAHFRSLFDIRLAQGSLTPVADLIRQIVGR